MAQAIKAGRGSVDSHLRVEVIDAGHRDWPAVLRQMDRQGRRDRLMVVADDGRLSSRQAVVAAFVDGRLVGHACFRVEPTRTPGGHAVVARMDSQAIDDPFAGTSVEHMLMTLSQSRARTMGCHGFAADEPTDEAELAATGVAA